MSHDDEDHRPDWLPKLDLRYLTRNPELCCTTIIVHWSLYSFEWIVMGELSRMDKRGNKGVWSIDARMADGATDFEHDSAYAMLMEIIAPRTDNVFHGTTWMSAFINPDPQGSHSFRIPTSNGYDPRKMVTSHMCEEPNCLQDGGPHSIVPEGYWLPPENPKLFEKLRGIPITIRVGVHHKDF